MIAKTYRGRIAPSPTGYLHIGHAITFWRAQERACAAGGKLILRIEDIDAARCRPQFGDAVIGDLKWFGLHWDEGPDIGGPFAPYVQSERRVLYLDTWEKLRAGGFIYPCRCSRKDVIEAGLAPHDENQEPVYPGTCRPKNTTAAVSDSVKAGPPLSDGRTDMSAPKKSNLPLAQRPLQPVGVNWRFYIPDGERVQFVDERLGRQIAIAGKDFGDFVVWRRDDLPAYQLAVVADDSAMQMAEVVRGEDLLLSTFRQLLMYRALGLRPPTFYHTPLIVDATGRRLAKRNSPLSLRELRASGITPDEIRQQYLL